MNNVPQALPEENGNEKNNTAQNNFMLLSQIMANASAPSFHELSISNHSGCTPVRKTHKCCVYIAGNKYCTRLNSIQAFMDINRDVSVEC